MAIFHELDSMTSLKFHRTFYIVKYVLVLVLNIMMQS